MTINTFLYSLKVWLTSVAVAPVFILFAFSLNNNLGYHSIGEQLENYLTSYFIFAILELVLSFLTWITFLIIIQVTTFLTLSPLLKRLLIFICAIILTATTLLLLFPLDFSNIQFEDITILLSNCFCIGAGCWFYKLDTA